MENEEIKNTRPRLILPARAKLLILLFLFAFLLSVFAYAQVLYCQGCGKVITGKYWKVQSQFSGEERIFCDNCYNTLPKCFICGLPAGNGRWTTPDARIICPFCAKEGVFGSQDIKKMYYYAAGALASVLNIKMLVIPELIVCQKKDFETLAAKYNIPSDNTYQFGFYTSNKVTYTRGAAKWQEVKDPRIYILNYIPYKVAMWVCAHELAHHFCAENLIVNLSTEEAEGFAEWAAYKILKHNNYGDYADCLTKRTDIYGRSLRTMLEKEQRYGTDALLKEFGVKK